jgi:tRNA nucleotidyltransferase (CCA-adding enzyme)
VSVAETLPRATDLLERLRAQPGGPELLALAPPRSFLVGGAVRDLLAETGMQAEGACLPASAETGTDSGDTRAARIPESASPAGECLPASAGRRPRELDVVVEGGDAPFGHAAARLAAALASHLGAGSTVNEHERFGTAIVEWGRGRIDIATARRELYPTPGALPEVQAASLADDLLRRDFTVNALACALDGTRPAELHAVPHAREDLHTGRLRVLHERSFLDDPTRLWRLGRYRARLGFTVEAHTAELAAAAVAGGALGTVSLARIGAELRLALAEADAVAALAALDELGVLAELHPRLRFDTRLARDALDLLSDAEGGTEPGPRPDLLLLAVLLQPMAVDLLEEDVQANMYALLEGMEFRASEGTLVTRAAICADALAEELVHAEAGSEIHAIASFESLESVALAGAWATPWSNTRTAAHLWLAELRNVRLRITGDDLLAAGIPEGPEIGRRLEAALCAKLDGELNGGREAELAAALRLP